MRPLHSLLLVLALAGAVAVAVWLVRGGERAPAFAPAVPEAELTQAPATGQRPGPRAPSDSAAAPERPAEAGARTAQEVPQQELGPRAQTVRTRSDGVELRGQVLDAAGSPLAGARVLAAAGGGLDLPLDARAAQRLPWMRVVEATSGADGRFVLEGMRPGPLRVAVRAAGHAPLDAGELRLPAEPRHELEPLRLEPGVAVSGRVVDAGGRPVAGAEVLRQAPPRSAFVLGGGGSDALAATTADDGSFTVDQLASGPFVLRVETDEHPAELVRGSTSRPGERVANLLVELEDGATLGGRVLGAPSAELPRLEVRASPAGQAGDAGGDDAPYEVRTAKVRPDGVFEVRGLRQGRRYGLTLRRGPRPGEPEPPDFFGEGLAERVVAQAGERGVELRWQPEAALVFQVVDARTRAPIEELEVSAGIDWPMPLFEEGGRRPKERFEQGRVRFGGLRPDGPGERAQLQVRATGYEELRREDIALVPGQETDLGVLALEPRPLLRVTVLDARSGEPVEGARVTLSLVEDEAEGRGGRVARTLALSSDDGEGEPLIPGDGTRRSARTDAEGRADLTSFGGRRSRLEVQHGTHAPYRGEPFVAAAGEHEERTVRLGPGGSVVVTLATDAGEPVAGARVEHQAPRAGDGFAFDWGGFGGGERGVTDAQGRTRFDRLEPGTHRFRAGAGGGGVFGASSAEAFVLRMRGGGGDGDGGWSEVAVEEGGEVQLALVAPRVLALEGRVREAGEPLPGATVGLSRGGEDDGRPRALQGGGPSATTDGQGRYRIEGVDAGRYTVRVTHPTRAMPAELALALEQDERAFDIDLDVAIVEGRVVDAAGEPVAGARVHAERARAAGAPSQVAVRMVAFAGDSGGMSIAMEHGAGETPAATTDAEGRYSLRGVQPGIDLEVVARAQPYQPARSEAFELAPDQVRRGVDLTLAAAGRIEVRAVRPDGSPGRNLLVLARHEAPPQERAQPQTGFVGGDGKALLEGLAPGPWRLTLRQVGPNTPDGELPAQVVEVKAEETASATFTVP